MDESERLIARAALGSPAEAVSLWQQWRETYDPATASDLLVWAGGYLHRNIVAGGARDDYLAGIARYNWVANQRQLLAAHDDLVELAALHPLVTLKSFDASRADGALSLRPVSDIDLYVDAVRVERVVSWLRRRGYVPLLEASDVELTNRIVPLRGSWNFTRAARAGVPGCSIDLHWKFFDGLSALENRRFADQWTLHTVASFGALRALIPEARFALMAVQRQAQHDGKDTVLFDAGHIVGQLDLPTLVAVARASRSHASVISLLNAIAEFSADPRVRELRDTAVRDLQKCERLVDRLSHFVSHKRWKAKRFVDRLSRFVSHERSRAHDLPPVSHSQNCTIVRLTEDLPSGSGWFYLLPGDTWRWSMAPEARLSIDVPNGLSSRRNENLTARVDVMLNTVAWAVCSAPQLDVICNGNVVGRIDKTVSTGSFAVPLATGSRILDLRLLGTGADLPASDPQSLVFNRIVAPVESVRISLSSQ